MSIEPTDEHVSGTGPAQRADAELGHTAAEQLSPAFPGRAPWGTASKLRRWQAEALTVYFEHEPRDFLVSATPGAGKTTFALRLAQELIARGTVSRIIVVAPTEHLKYQWAEAAERVHLRLDPRFRNSDRVIGRQYRGAAVTYAQVALKPEVIRRLVAERDTLVILDEVHHGGDTLSWGDGIRDAFDPAARRLSLTGTPFRSDDAPIPYVTYLPDEHGVRISQTDYSYGYGRALADGVVRPVVFLAYAGEMRWRTRAGDEVTAELAGENTKDVTAGAWRTALDPEGEWIPAVLASADRRLSEVRRAVPDAGGLVVATDQADARAYADLLWRISGEQPTVVLSDEADGSERIASFSASDRRWMVAVRMVSEGVDVPRLAVGVYATSASTPLFFAQLVGRFVRARRRGEVASLFLPSVPVLLELAAQLELERDHALGRREGDGEEYPEEMLLAAAERPEQASDALADPEYEFRALGSTPMFDRVLFDGAEFGQQVVPGTPEELDFIGLPGILDPEQVSELLKQRQRRQARRIQRKEPKRQEPEVPLHQQLMDRRRELSRLVSVWAKISGEPHGSIHAKLRRLSGGPSVSSATLAELDRRISALRSWIGR